MIYVGQHQTENIDDGYMGSGIRIVRAIEKYGVENFEKTILFECSSIEEMNAKEAEIVNEEFIARDDVYNVIVGGENGSWEKVHQQGLHHLGGVNAMKKNKLEGRQIWADFWNSLTVDQKEQWKKLHPKAQKRRWPSWNGKHHSTETKKKMSLAKKGKGCGCENSNYGNNWIHNDELKLRICVPNALYWDYLATGWINGRGSFMSKESREKCRVASQKQIRYHYVNNGSIEKHIAINEAIPEGFQRGRLKGKTWKSKTSKDKRIARSQRLRDKRYQELKPMLEVYETEGFEAVVLKFNYKFTRNNLVQAFKKYIPEYVPNVHTNQTKAKIYQQSLSNVYFN